ncbi:MAG: response regulator, partial [Microcoleus sp. C1-bin4]|nr:response regulator [Microcoleus sp. C1-bin4]
AEEFARKVISTSAVGSLIAMTALREQPKAEALCSRGFSGYLIEPVRPSRLLEAMLAPIKGTGESGTLEAANTCTLPAVNSQYVTPNSPSSLRILVAEDHPINQQVLVEQLAVLGYQADCVVNGQQALDLLAEKSYDLVLMDCQMPVLDGYKTAQKLREIEGSDRHTFVMALTAHAMPGEREKCLAAGMDDYLSKPVDLDALAAALKKYEARNVQCENKYVVKSINSENKSQLATNYTEVVEKAQVVAVQTPRASTLQTWEHRDCDGLFDKSRLEQLARIHIKLPERLLQAFVAGAQADVAAAKRALEAQDWQAVEYQAHRLKGTSANVGVAQMSDLATQLEHQARGFKSEPPGVEFSKIERLENILVSLSSHLARVQEFVETRMFG